MIHPTNSNLQVLSEGQNQAESNKRKKEILIGQGQKSKIQNPNRVLKIKQNYKRHKAKAERRHTWTWTHGLVQTRKINKSQVRLIKAETNNPTVEEKEQGVWKQEELRTSNSYQYHRK